MARELRPGSHDDGSQKRLEGVSKNAGAMCGSGDGDSNQKALGARRLVRASKVVLLTALIAVDSSLRRIKSDIEEGIDKDFFQTYLRYVSRSTPPSPPSPKLV